MQETELRLYGKVMPDLAMWIPTPDISDGELESFAYRYIGEMSGYEDICRVEKDAGLTSVPISARAWFDEPRSHVSTARTKTGEWLAAARGLKLPVAEVRTKGEVKLVLDLLKAHVQISPDGTLRRKIDEDALARDFNRTVLARPPGTGLRLKSSAFIRQYLNDMTKRIQVDHAQRPLLEQVSCISQCKPTHELICMIMDGRTYRINTLCEKEVGSMCMIVVLRVHDCEPHFRH